MADREKTSRKKAISKSGSKDTMEVEQHEEGQSTPSRTIEIRGVVEKSSYPNYLPSPDDVGEYEGFLPKAADRIFSMAERNQQARIESHRLGLIFGFSLGIACLIALVLIALYAPNPYAFPSGIAGIGVIVSVIFYLFKGGKKD